MTSSASPPRRLLLLASCAAIVAAASACGTRVSHARLVAAGNGYNAATAQTSTTAGAVGATPVTGAAPTDGSAAVAPPTDAPAATGSDSGSLPANTSGGTGPQAAPAPGAGSTAAATTTAPAVKGGAASPTAKGTQPTTATKTAAVAAGTPCTKQLKPVVIGQTAALSGLVGAAVANIRVGLTVWSKYINSQGGVQCHPVVLYTEDDDSDPARVSSNWNDLIHSKNAVAMVGAGVPLTAAALRSVAERDKVPVVGGDIVPTDWIQSPYLFPQGGSPLNGIDGAVAQAVKATPGTDKVGLLYCVEASICTQIENNFPNSVKKANVAEGPVAAVSLTQTDFSSECQAQKDAGIKALFVAVDGSAAARVARSCAALGYHPVFIMDAISVSAQASSDSNLRSNTVYLGSSLVPQTVTSTPATQLFHSALNQYAPGAPVDESTMNGWASGQLFAAALAAVSSEARAGDITTQTVLDGLYALKNETLGGLSPGVTFHKGGLPTVMPCYYPLKITTSGFSAPNDAQSICNP